MSYTRLVQRGAGERRDLVVVYYLAPNNDSTVKQAIGPDAIIVNDTRRETSGYGVAGPRGIEPIDEMVRRLQRDLGTTIRSVTLAGWSIGCKAIRTQLLWADGRIDIAAVVPIDGTHASYPVPTSDQVDPWRKFCDDAKLESCVFAASHTMLTYVERLPNPYMSAWRVLKLVTDFALDKQGPNDSPVQTERGFCSVWSYQAASAAGHAFQGMHVLPKLARLALERVRVMLARVPDRPILHDQAPIDLGDRLPWRNSNLSLGERAVAWSLAQVGKMQEQPAGSNGGPDVELVLRPCVRYGKSLGLQQGNWCAAFACYAEHISRLEGDAPPVHEYRCSGIELEHDARLAGAWCPVSRVRLQTTELDPGDIVIWQRGKPGAWQRHVARFVRWVNQAAGQFEAVGGNENETVQVSTRDLSDSRLRGFILLPAHHIHLTSNMAETANPIVSDECKNQIAMVDPLNDGDDTVIA